MPTGVYDNWKIRGRKGIPHPWCVGDRNPAKRPEVREKISLAKKGKPNFKLRGRHRHFSEDHRKKIALAMTGRLPWWVLKGEPPPASRPIVRLKLSLAHKGKHLSEKHKRNIGLGHRGICRTEKSKKKISQIITELWKGEMGKNIWKALNKKPNQSEILLDSLIQKIVPNKYKYVGDGEFILGGKCPDFMNINGKKKLIELFGDYWHGEEKIGVGKAEAERQRIKHFAKYGFNTLIIWGRELENLGGIEEKIRRFTNG